MNVLMAMACSIWYNGSVGVMKRTGGYPSATWLTWKLWTIGYLVCVKRDLFFQSQGVEHICSRFQIFGAYRHNFVLLVLDARFGV